MSKPKVKMVCAECGGANVLRDAYASWDDTAQEWILAQDPFDAAICEDCEGDCQIDEVEMTPEEIAELEDEE